MRVVLDVNVVVSALLSSESTSRRIFDQALARGRILISSAVVAELDAVLRRPKFNRYLSEDLRIEFLTALVREAELVEVTNEWHVVRDRDDDKLIQLAVAGRANFLITGDSDLLVLHPFQGIEILNPRDFLLRCESMRRG